MLDLSITSKYGILFLILRQFEIIILILPDDGCHVLLSTIGNYFYIVKMM